MKVKKRVWAWLAAALAVFAIVMFGTNVALADAGDPPEVGKSRDDNGDGTYKIELSVKGDADNKDENASHVNVLIIYDESSSMVSNTDDPRRADVAEDAVHTLVSGLAGYSSQGADIYMAEVGFGTGSNTRTNWTSNLGTVLNHFDEGVEGGGNANNWTGSAHGNYGYNGTNWASALERADGLLDDLANVGGKDRSGYPTFVILVTDGGPTAGGSGGTTVPGPNVPWTSYRNHYSAATTYAHSIQDRPNTTLFGIYALGTDANLLDDLMYYANTGTHRTVDGYSIATATQQQHNFGRDEGADNYYTAENAEALNDAISDIFSKIVETLGITEVSMSDGTTSNVSTSSGDISLLCVDEDSYQYWMSIPVDSNNQFKRTKNVGDSENQHAEEITYTVASDGTVTWTEGGASKSVKLNGSVKNNQFRFEWTQDDFPNDFYEYAPEDAELVGSAVEWDLSNVGVLLDGVTYSVSFDVYPSQTALDYTARLDNGEAYEDVVPEAAREYFHEDGSVETNTNGSVTYSDSRDGSGPNTAELVNPPAVPTKSESMTVKKEWEGATAPNTDLKLDILMDGDEEHPFYEATLNSTGSWEAEFNISAGLIVDDEALPGAMGHDFSFAELDDTQYRWELHAPTVRPMIINGADEPTMLIKADPENGYDPSGKKTYTIDGAKYYVDPAISTLTATNHRRSNLNLKKVVTGDDAPEDAAFPFTLTVNNIKAPETEPTDDPEHNSDYWVWFSIRDADENFVTTDANVSGAEQSGNYFYAPSGSEITVDMKDGWNLRFTNLPSGTTYTFTEDGVAGFTLDSAENTGADDDTFALDGNTATGTIVTYDAKAYEVTYTNKYEPVDVTVTKEWDDDSDAAGMRPEELELTLNGAPDGFEVDDPEITIDGDTWTYVWSGLPKNDADGEEIEYTVTEEEVPEGYKCDETEAENGGTITNEFALVDITVTKAWDDDSDENGIRPDELELTISPAVDVDPVIDMDTDPDNWTYTWAGIPKFDENGEEIEYTVTEEEVPEGYKCDETEAENGGTITNEFALVDITVTKAWDDDSDENGIRPDELELTISPAVDVDPVIDMDTDPDNWTYTWAGIPKFDENGEEIEYLVSEETVPTGYKCDDTEVEADGTITNTYALTDVTVTKTWDDANDVDGKRPASLTLTLNGAPDGFEVDDPDVTKDGNTWTYVWSGLPKYDADGEEIEYTVSEEEVPEYYTCDDTEVEAGGEIKNTHTREKTAITVTKTWEGPEAANGATIHLFADGNELTDVSPQTLSSSNDNTFTWNNLPVYRDGGTEIDYTVTEDAITGYKTTGPEETDDGFSFTNSYLAEGEVQIKLYKDYQGGTLEDGMFEFTIEAVTEGAPLPDSTTVTNEGTSVDFGTITFTQEHLYGTTSEESGEEGGKAEDGDSTDDPASTEGTDEAPATRSIQLDASDEGAADDGAADEDEFSNDVVADAATDTAADAATDTVDEETEATDEPSLIVDLANVLGLNNLFAPKAAYADEVRAAGTSKTFEYKITETAGSEDYIEYASDPISVFVTVTDDGEGNLTCTVEPKDPKALTFVNEYKAEGTATIEATKVLESAIEGVELEDGQFSFELKDSSGNVIETVTNDASGNVQFTALEYYQNAEQRDAGKTFKYTITEVKGNETGYTYDTHTCSVTVKVTDDGKGTLNTEVSYSGGQTFTNTYKPKPVKIDPPIKKVITGDTPSTDETFTFQMTAITEGAPMPEGSSDGVKTVSIKGSGEYEFGWIEYTEEGVYEYEVAEVAGSNSNYTYDSNKYTITVTVTDEGGQLVATVEGGEDEEGLTTFTNTYTAPPTPPKPPVVPKTGDETPQTGLLALLGAALLGYGVYRRRKA